MVKCKHCDTENEDNLTHCQNCGKKLLETTDKKNINKILFVGLGILGFRNNNAHILFNQPPWISEFDQGLINSVKNNESSESLILKIKEHSNINRRV